MRDDGSGKRREHPPAPSARTSTGQVPVAGGGGRTAQSAPPRTTTGQVPVAGGGVRSGQPARTSTGQVPVAGGGGARPQSPASTPRAAATAPSRTASSAGIPVTALPPKHLLARELGGVENAQQAQQHMLQSAFADDDETTQFDALLGARRAPASPFDDEEVTSFAQQFDGTAAPEALRSRDLYKALHPPVQSREGRRSQEAYRLVLDQFAVGTNPRYEPDAPGKPRAHIFVWDVTRAMGVEVPHFLGSRELTLAQTVDWLRHEGPMKGWRRCSELEAWQAANGGHPVIAVPKEVRIKLLAMARPGDFNDDGKPFLSAAALERGNALSVKQAFNVFAVEFFAHA